ncbi:hypothetical protein [Calditerrivibrio nitroreducens]|uniref:Uncharacterized protein n=1 Tax=Calditerrivibrio nitroreducens (strain DSM 19672 / NBRC 101217 / Yu37-1) TaxID=768670 RepID=E4TFN8_CALNY|nr:hypothetical protein [Calditerrivibrio nitroreducens]ADR18506.1 hypothetical protein Calni_0594 [Calditerrivibrio nitroreducens DSM 19672]
MREEVLEMKQRLILFDEMQATEEEVLSEVGMSLDSYEETAERHYEALSDEDKEWVDKQLFEWFKNYKQFFGGGCSLNCSSCGKHNLEF